MGIDQTDENFMAQALALARQAADAGEVPVGAVVVEEGKVIGTGFNQPVSRHDPSAHAEIVALRAAGACKGNYRLPGTTLYVTLEPCMMCAGAMVHARIHRLVIGALEGKAGAVVTHPSLQQDWLNHKVLVSTGILAQQCSRLLTDFFVQRRAAQGKAADPLDHFTPRA